MKTTVEQLKEEIEELKLRNKELKILEQSSILCTHEKTIDWEQRRYEIVKEILSRNLTVRISEAISHADRLIAFLKEKYKN